MKIRSVRRGDLWRAIGALVLALSWASQAMAQGETLQELLDLSPKGRGGAKPKFVTTLTPAPGKTVDSLKPGDEVTLTVGVTLPHGYYIYGTDGTFGGRTVIKLAANGGTLEESKLEPIDADWVPDREPKRLFEPLLQAEVSKFHDRVTWKKRLRLTAGTDASQVRITGELTGQYCSEGLNGEGQCIPIIPPHQFEVAITSVSDAASSGEAAAPAFDYAERPHKGKTRPAILRFQLTPSDAKPGEKVTLSITAKMDEGWHTFSLTQNGPGGLATEIEIENSPGLKPLGEGFVADHKFEKEPGAEPGTTLEVHNSLVTWSRSFEVLPGTKPGQYSAAGTITFQVCKTSCLPPRPVTFELPHSGEADAKLNPPRPEDYIRSATAKHDRPQDKGLIPFLLLAFGWGFVSLLTPCVFPMVPITVSFFLKQNESQHSRPLLLALVYCITIVATFSLIGVGVTALFGAGNTLNALATGAVANLFIGIVFTAFALNMLGMFEMRVPSWVLNWSAQRESAGGYLGAVFMALTFTLTSFTCTFAFAGSVLVSAANGEYFWPLLGMGAFGLAFALPFFVLALLPGLLKKLPKSGGWMNSVKVVMGLIELGFAFKFFSIVDQQWNAVPVLFDFTNVMAVWAILSFVTGLYLLAVFQFDHDSPPRGLSVPRVLLATAFLTLSGLFAVGLMNPERESWLIDQLVSFAPARLDDDFGLDFDVGVADATAGQRPLFIDFTGVFCTNCRLMEKKMARRAIRKKLERYVGLKLYTDRVPGVSDAAESARLLKRNIELQTKWFGDVTLPSYAIVTPDGKTILSSYLGLELKDGEFAAFLDEGWKKWQAMRGEVKTAYTQPAPSLPDGVQLALNHHRPILTSFVCDFDVNSIVAEKKINRALLAAPNSQFIQVRLPLQSNRWNVKESVAKRNLDLLNSTIGEVVIPTFVIMDSNGKTTLSSHFSAEQKDGEFAKFLDEGWKKWQAGRGAGL